MRALNRKLLRDIRHTWAQVLAISLVMASGVGTFVMSLSTYDSLGRMQAEYYASYRFADVFAFMERAPATVAGRITDLSGVDRVQTRVVADALLDVPRLSEPGTARLISIPPNRQPELNALSLQRGNWPDPTARDQVIANEPFMRAHGLDPGDQLDIVVDGTQRTVTIVGSALSPEYVIQVGERDLLPDHERFGVFWMLEEDLQALYDMEGAFNSVTLTLQPDAIEEDVLHRLDLLLESYGSPGAYTREDHLPHRYLSDDIAQLRAIAVIVPTIFLAVAAFLLNAVISRLIQTQREQIAALRAFGYSRTQIGWHYIKLVLVIALLATALGTGIGAWLGSGLTRLYTGEFYLFPEPYYTLAPPLVLLAAVVCGAAALLGVGNAVRRAANLPPAEAMRPEPPASFKPTVIERLGLQALLPQTGRMILRELERRPLRAGLSCLGIAAAVGILMLGRFSVDAFDELMDLQFERVQRQDLQVSFVRASPGSALHDLKRMPGVQHVEPFRTVPATFVAGPRQRQLAIMGLEAEPELFRVLDQDDRSIAVPEHGLLVSSALAEVLGVQPGDTITVRIQEGRQPEVNVPVTATVDDWFGLNAYMHRRELNRLMREADHVSGAYMLVDDRQLERLYGRLHETPVVASVLIRRAMYANFQETMVETQRIVQSVNIIFAVIIAFGVVYNTARITLAERTRDLATLRVLGFTRHEISTILLGELAVLTLLALPIGALLGTGFVWLASAGLQTEFYRIPMVISRFTVGFAMALVLLAAFLSGLLVRRRIDRLDLIAVLKARE